MRTLFVDESISHEPEFDRPGFFARQFGPERTEPQLIFDLLIGVIGPVVCFFADPIVFKGGMIGLGSPLYGRFQLLAYGVALIEIPILVCWLGLGRHLLSFSAPIGGVLIAGAVFSFVIGVFIFPFSVMGLFVIVGVLGFTPFLTAFVFLRNGVRALGGQVHNAAHSSRYLTATFAGLLAFGLPVLANRAWVQTTNQACHEIVNGDKKQADLAVNQLQSLPFIPQESLDQIIVAFQTTEDPARREWLGNCYREITGEDIDRRIHLLDD